MTNDRKMTWDELAAENSKLKTTMQELRKDVAEIWWSPPRGVTPKCDADHIRNSQALESLIRKYCISPKDILG